MVVQTIKRPSIPQKYYRPSLLGSVVFIVYALALFFVPASLCRVVATTSFCPLLLKIVVLVPLTIIAGYGILLMGIIGHEGFHLSLHSNKLVSAILGLFFASAVVTYFNVGSMMYHWSHHRFTNQPSDPDIQMLEPLKTWWQRLLFSRLVRNFHYFKITLNTAIGRPLPFPNMMLFKLATVRKLCWLNFAFSLFWISFYVGITLYDPLTGLFSIALPMLGLLFVSGCQSYIDHAGTSDDMFHNSWSRTSPIMTALYFGNNYHLEHHLYPKVPCYRLPKIHKLLKESGLYEQVKPTIEPSFFGAYRRLTSDFNVEDEDSTFNPFEISTESFAGTSKNNKYC